MASTIDKSKFWKYFIYFEIEVPKASFLSSFPPERKYFFTFPGGKDDKKDAFGTSISKYIKYFQNFDLSMVEAVRKPKV